MNHPAAGGPPRKSGVSWGTLIGGLLLVLPLLGIMLSGLFHNPHDIGNALADQPAPAFTLPRLADGSQVQLSQFRGQPVVINFWATWCQSCPLEHPVLVDGARRYGSQVQFLGIAYEDKKPALNAWLTRHGGSSYPTLVDVGGKVAVAYGVYGVPETYFIDRSGVIRDKHVGPIDPRTLRSQIEGIL